MPIARGMVSHRKYIESGIFAWLQSVVNLEQVTVVIKLSCQSEIKTTA